MRGIRLVCLPYAGAGTAPFAGLDWLARPAFEVAAVRLPGRDGEFDHAPLRTWQEVRALLEAAVVPTLTGDYVIYGHGTGALMAYELCRIAEDRGIPPIALCVAACPGPGADGPTFRPGFRDDDQLVDHLTPAGDDVTTRSLPPEVLELVLPALRADLALADSWRAGVGATLRSPVLALHGADDHTMDASQALAWERWTTGLFEVATVAGGHLFVRDKPAQVLDAVTAFVARCVIHS